MFLRSLLLVFVLVFAADAAPRVEVARRGYFSRPTFTEGRDGALYGWQYPGRIYRFARDGQFRVVHDFGQEIFPGFLVAAADGHLYLSAAEFPALYRVSYQGVAEEIWAASGFIGIPRGLVAGFDENVYGLADGKVFRLSPAGEFSVVASPENFESHNLFPGPDGTLWVSGANEQFQPAIRRVALDGSVTDPITSGSLLGHVGSLHFLPDGSVFGFSHLPLGPPWIVTARAFFRIDAAGGITPLAQFPVSFEAGTGTFDEEGRYVYADREESTQRWRFLAVDSQGEIQILASLPRSSPLDLSYGGLLSMRDGSLFATATGPWTGQIYKPGALLRIRGAARGQRNSPPLARADFRRPPQPGGGMWINVLANDFDLNGDALELTKVYAPLHGAVTADFARGRVYYTAPAGEPVLVDEIRYHIADGKGGVAVGQVIIRQNLRGSFASILESESPEADGRIGVTLGNFGALTGHVWLGGRRESFAGRLDAANRFVLKRVRDSVPVLTLRLELRADPSGQPVVAAEIETPKGSFEAELARPSSAVAASAAGAYTLALPSDPAWAAEPEYLGGWNVPLRRNPIFGVQGHGIASLRVSKSGLAFVAGTLPDGVPFAGGQLLGPGGQLPLFAVFKARNSSPDEARKGWITGSVGLANARGAGDAAGSARWIQPWATTAYTQTDSFFERSVDVLASHYLAPAQLQSEDWNALQVSAADGGLPSLVSASVSVTGNALAGILPLRINGNFAPATGFVSGHVSFPGWGAWTSYRGVLLRQQGRIVGQFKALTGRGTGNIALQPE